MIKSLIKKSVTPFKPLLERVAGIEANISRAWAASAHRRLFKIQWFLPPEPEYFDHHIDVHWLWGTEGNSLWLERGVYSSLAIRQGAHILELCCGDGFNAKHFYAHRAASVLAVDFDPKAIQSAKNMHAFPNITFLVADVRSAMPRGVFDNVIWDAAIEHFTLDEIRAILAEIKVRLSPQGTLSGYTIVERPGGKSLSHHEYEFKDKEDLFRVLKSEFKNVLVFETVYPVRHNLYFWAGNAIIPFSKHWPLSLSAFSD